MGGDGGTWLLQVRCPVCGAENPVTTTLAQLRELYRQDYPVSEIYPEKSAAEIAPMLFGICPGCWAAITGTRACEEDGHMHVRPALLEMELRTDKVRLPRRPKVRRPRRKAARRYRGPSRVMLTAPPRLFMLGNSMPYRCKKYKGNQWIMRRDGKSPR